MGKQLQNLTFDEWLIYVFDHPVPTDGQNEWYWDLERDDWIEVPEDAIRFMTRAFEHAGEVLEPYSDAQLNQGLWFLASNACSNHMFALMDESLPWSARERCIESIYPLFEQCFARRCSPHLSHVDEPGASPLNLVCYMWWDIIPISGKPDEPTRRELDAAILRVMESTLQLNSIACLESALHGLGHWQMYYPDRVREIIDRFSMRRADLPEKLQFYRKAAYAGCVL
jgi:hypothetical protein